MILTKSIIHNNSSSSEKVFWSESGEKSAQIRDVEMHFFTEEALLWIMDSMVFELKTS